MLLPKAEFALIWTLRHPLEEGKRAECGEVGDWPSA